MAPQHRMCNACQLSHTHGLASSAFARHYSRNHFCFLFLRVLRCFTSPRSLQLPYIFRQRLPDMTPVFQGFPIRKSTDQSSFTSSPWLIAGYNVLHRLLVPRHPPIALSSLSKKSFNITKMLASTVQFSKYGRYHQQQPTKSRPSSEWFDRRRCKSNRPFRTPTACSHQPSNHNHFPLPKGLYSHS